MTRINTAEERCRVILAELDDARMHQAQSASANLTLLRELDRIRLQLRDYEAALKHCIKSTGGYTGGAPQEALDRHGVSSLTWNAQDERAKLPACEYTAKGER